MRLAQPSSTAPFEGLNVADWLTRGTPGAVSNGFEGCLCRASHNLVAPWGMTKGGEIQVRPEGSPETDSHIAALAAVVTLATMAWLNGLAQQEPM
jgi:hypothetical protein